MKTKKLISQISGAVDIAQPKNDSNQSMDNLSIIPSEFQCEYNQEPV